MSKFKTALMLTLLLALAATLSVSAQGPDSYTTGFQVANLADTEAQIAIEFVDKNGTVVDTLDDQIPANEANTYYPLPADVPAGFDGSVVISSDQPLAAITNVLGTEGDTVGDFGGADYTGLNQTSDQVFIPQVMNNYFGIFTWFNVQNAGNQPVEVTVNYTGNLGSCSEGPVTIPAKAAHTFDQSQTNAACVTAGFLGAATVQATNDTDEIVATVMQYNDQSLLAYNGFATNGAPELVIPFVSQQWYNSRTGIQMQNTGTQATNVTLTFYPSEGFPGQQCTQTLAIPAGGSTKFADTELFGTGNCGPMSGANQANYGFVGSAAVTANSTNQPLVGIVNTITTGTPNGADYNAAIPTEATSMVTFPQIMDRYFGIFTGFSVANVGTQQTEVTCTFVNSPLVVNQLVDPGAALTHVQLNEIADGYNGAATCTASGGDAMIVGIVSQLGGVPGADQLLYYEGANH